MKRRPLRPSLKGLRRVAMLRSYTPLHSRSELKRSAMPAAKAGRPVAAEVRSLVRERSGGWCEVASRACWTRAVEMHHRVLRQSGGRHGCALVKSDRASNLIHMCPPCHEWVHENRWEALPFGWWVPRGVDPVGRAVLLRRHHEDPVYLDDAGGWHPFEEAGA